MSKRIYLFDNLKFLLILLVVIGHVIDFYTFDYKFFRLLFFLIYTFHMPLFIFITGLFQKRINKFSDVSWKKIIYYLVLVYIMKMLLFSVGLFLNIDLTFEIFGGIHYYWYLFSISFYVLLNPIIEKFNFKFLIIFSFLLGVFSGYDNMVGDFLYLSRIIVFFPFYLLGYNYCDDRKKLVKILKKKSVKLLSLIVVIIFILVCVKKIDLLYNYRGLITGRNPFAFISNVNCEWYHRLISYLISFIIGLSFISLVPNRKIRVISNLGKRTLQVYILHQPVNFFFWGIGLYDFLRKELGVLYFKFGLILVALIIYLFLSLNIFKNALLILNNSIFKTND